MPGWKPDHQLPVAALVEGGHRVGEINCLTCNRSRENDLVRLTNELPPLVSIQQAAAWLSVSPKTIRRRIGEGELSAKRIGPRLLRVHRESLLAYGNPIGPY